jgi:hypothetical protein
MRLRCFLQYTLYRQRNDEYKSALSAPLPEVHSFPLLGASVTACRMFVLSPLNYLENQASDLLITIADMTEAPRLDTGLAKVFLFHSLIVGSNIIALNLGIYALQPESMSVVLRLPVVVRRRKCRRSQGTNFRVGESILIISFLRKLTEI